MLKLSSRTKYGLRALINLIQNYSNKPVNIEKIAKDEGISIRYLENIFTKLRAGGILKSKKGKSGGFMLSKSPSKINLFEIIEILEKDKTLVECLKSGKSCDRIDKCIAKDFYFFISKNIENSLKNITLEDIIRRDFKKYEKGILFW